MSNNIRDYITTDEPFGPIDSIDINSHDVRTLDSLFERHNQIYKNLRYRPSIIVGRRGAGKTSYLRSVFFDKQYDYYTEIRTAHMLAHMAKVIQDMTQEAVFSELVSELWETILWVSVFSEMRRHPLLPVEDLKIVNLYLTEAGIKENDSIDDVLMTIAITFGDAMRNKPKGLVSDVLRRFEKATFEQARNVITKNLESRKKTFVILLDSLDDFQVGIESVHRALQGLLKLVGAMNKPKDVVDIRFCLPTEIYHKFVNLSSNPNKDFRRSLKLQWTARELILIGAQRLEFYLALYHDEFYKKLCPLGITKRNSGLELFQTVLPEKITNIYGHQEDTLSYILRHTQLLPRHFLMLLNSIFRIPKEAANLYPFPINEAKIINGIREVEELILREVFISYRLIYPTAEETCKRCIPELAHKFTSADLHRVFNRHGKAVFGGDDYFEFQRMLLEIGAIGRVISGKDTDLYIKGNFEYTVSHELVVSIDHELCVHPIFSGIYKNNRKAEHPVYPYGSILDDEDYRVSLTSS